MKLAASVLALAIAACARAPAPAPRSPAPPPIARMAPAEPVKPAAPTEAEITKRSHELLEAFDRGDHAALSVALAPGFVHFEGGAPQDREALLGMVAKRKPGVPYIAKRTWDKVRVIRHDDDAVFIGKANEVQGGNETHDGGYIYVGWYMLQWIRSGDGWKLQLWTWQRESSERDTWNQIFRNARGFSKQPNRLLVETVEGRKPGAALDVAMGQGRNALYLASQGWKVTGVDISDEGLRIARDQAIKRKLAIEAINVDINSYDFGKNRWDLVTMIYATNNTQWIEKIKPSLKKGGLFIVEYFASEPGSDSGFAAGQLAKLFAEGFEITRDEAVEDVPDWAMDRAKLVRFVARKR
jgi:SAM-dependent methyltransferase